MIRILAIISLLSAHVLFAQTPGFVHGFSIEKKHDYIWTDNLQNLYIIHESAIEMHTATGEMRYENSQLNLGRITSVDLNFSLKPMLFFGDQNVVVILDNTLSMQGNPVRLNEYQLNWVTAAAKSIDNHFWFFDMQNFELVRTDHSFNKIRSSGNISQMLQVDIQPNFIVEHDNWVYVNNPETGILVFDIFGTYFKQIPIKGLNTFQVTERNIIYFQENRLHQYDLMTFETGEIVLPENNVRGARVSKDLLYLSGDHQISVYQKIQAER